MPFDRELIKAKAAELAAKGVFIASGNSYFWRTASVQKRLAYLPLHGGKAPPLITAAENKESFLL